MPNARLASLAGWYVISLRPLGRHGAVRRAAAARGARVFAVSTLRLLGLDAAGSLAAALAADKVIATSPAAVAFAAQQAPLRRRRGQTWFAVGAGTARALERAGIADAQRSLHGANSDALLALPALTDVRGQAIGLLTAPGGRDVIAPTLRRRGAELQVAAVYRRVPQRPAPHRLAALAALPATHSALLVTSGEALRELWQALDRRGRAALCARWCVVASARLDAEAAALGFTRRVRADATRPTAMLEALATRAAAGSRRFR